MELDFVNGTWQEKSFTAFSGYSIYLRKTWWRYSKTLAWLLQFIRNFKKTWSYKFWNKWLFCRPNEFITTNTRFIQKGSHPIYHICMFFPSIFQNFWRKKIYLGFSTSSIEKKNHNQVQYIYYFFGGNLRPINYII